MSIINLDDINETPRPKRRPEWIKVRAPSGETYDWLKDLMRSKSLHTVCEEAMCPNIGECWGSGTATFLMLGDTCTRSCGFCDIKTGRPGAMDWQEPFRVAESVRAMNLQHVVITSVNRDERKDGGAPIFAMVIKRIRQVHPGCSIEVLIPDFKGDRDNLKIVMDAQPEILNHNVETVPRLFLISASATSPDITNLSDNNLVWRTCPSDKLQAQPMSLLVSATETRLRADLGLLASEDIRVAAINKGDSYGSGLAENITPLLNFNGQSASENGDANYLGRQYPDPSEEPNFDYSSLLAEILTFKPHIILPLGTNEGLTEIVIPVEQQWASQHGSDPRPYYVIPDGGRLTELTDYIEGLEQGGDSAGALDLRARIRGTVPGLKGPNFQAFSLAYKASFGDDPGTFSEHAYDSAYLITYASVAGGMPVTGASLANGLMMMSEGNTLSVGPNELNNALNALSAGGSFNFDGASGPLDFDNATGEAPVDFDIWCVTFNTTTDAASFSSSGQIWNAATQQLEGSPSVCDEVPMP